MHSVKFDKWHDANKDIVTFMKDKVKWQKYRKEKNPVSNRLDGSYSTKYNNREWYPNGEYTHESGATRTFDITQFHTYTVLWNENVLQFAVDGNEHFTLNIKDSARQTNSFHGNFYFLLNVAVGGNWPGFDIDDNQFPTEMQVDYIRVYKN